MTEPKSGYGPKKVAAICGLAKNTVRQWIDEGALRGYKLPSGHRRVRKEDLISFCRSNGLRDALAKLGVAESRVVVTFGLGVEMHGRLHDLLVSFGGEAKMALSPTQLGWLLRDRPHGIVFDFAVGRSRCVEAAGETKRLMPSCKTVGLSLDDEGSYPAPEKCDAVLSRNLFNPGDVCALLNSNWEN